MRMTPILLSNLKVRFQDKDKKIKELYVIGADFDLKVSEANMVVLDEREDGMFFPMTAGSVSQQHGWKIIGLVIRDSTRQPKP